jgi:diguanylate cyclase (GGDEF)-like protein
MDPTPFVAAARELRQRFVALLDSLSAVRALSEMDCARPRDDRELMVGALEALMQHQDLARCSVFLLRDDTLTCAAGRDYAEGVREVAEGIGPERKYDPRTFRVGEGIIGLAAQTGQLQYCADCSSDPRFSPHAGEVGSPPGSLICAPVSDGAQTLGVVNVFHPEPEFFQDWHRQVVATYAGILGHMLAHHRAMQHLESQVQQRTQQLELALAEAEHLKRRYEELSTVDELTGLHNRRFFFTEAEAALARALRYRHPFCLMLVDLDFFKQINDTFGHSVGDAALRDLANALRRHTREGDILARFGGEEFVIALPNSVMPGARALAERIQEHIGQLHWEVEGVTFGLTVSIGLASLEPDARQSGRPLLDELVRQADKALYHCKYNGRNRVFAFSDLPAPLRAAIGR